MSPNRPVSVAPPITLTHLQSEPNSPAPSARAQLVLSSLTSTWHSLAGLAGAGPLQEGGTSGFPRLEEGRKGTGEGRDITYSVELFEGCPKGGGSERRRQ